MADDGEEVVVEMQPMQKSPSSPYQQKEGDKTVALSWEDLVYEVPEVTGTIIKRETGHKRTLLNKVSGCVLPGEVVAVMGPSGCGKSTLLDVLTGRVKQGKNSGLTGDIMVNGKVTTGREIKKHAAYVMQDDALYGVLTVRENLYYSAMLRLPESMSKEEKLERVEEVISELGLNKCSDTKIGNVFFRGVSGGERRRCSIGMELITRPSILLLDEPTSGLDSKSSRMICETLQKLARTEGKTIIATIHQPSTQVFQLFDKVMLLSQGEQIFFGPASEAMQFFATCGHPVPEYMNPADHFLETINFDFSEEGEGGGVDESGRRKMPPHIRHIADEYAKSSQKELLRDCIESKRVAEHTHEDISKYDTNSFTQFWYLCDRTFWTYIRDPGIFWARIVMYAMMAVVMGTLYLRMDYAQTTIQDRISVLFFSVAFLCFMSVAALPAFLVEREIFIRERRNAYYRVLPFSLSHSLVGIPFIYLIAFSFSAISYFMMNLHETAEAYFYFTIVLGLSLMCAEGMVTSISAVTPSFIVGIAIGAAMFGFYMLVCGFFLRKTNIPDYWIWMYYIVFHRYAFEGFMVNQFESETYQCTMSPQFANNCSCFLPDLNGNCMIEGIEILTEYEYQDVNKWYWLLVLIGMAIFYYMLFYVFLRVFNTGER